ncbi:MAG: hypothetical protein WA173_13515 [Pseudomonas sp.]
MSESNPEDSFWLDAAQDKRSGRPLRGAAGTGAKRCIDARFPA